MKGLSSVTTKKLGHAQTEEMKVLSTVSRENPLMVIKESPTIEVNMRDISPAASRESLGPKNEDIAHLDSAQREEADPTPLALNRQTTSGDGRTESQKMENIYRVSVV